MRDAADVSILVVDDNPGTLYSTSRVLRAAGFKVLEAASGGEALGRVGDVDLVVLDINLPDIDGFEVCRRIRANKATARTPVVHLSATYVGEQDKIRGLNHGADGYLTHPVEAPVLIATIQAFLRARQAEEAMHESEAKFRTIFDQTPHGVALVSEDFVYLEANPAMCRILGWPREQIVGKHNSAFMPVGYENQIVSISRELEQKSVWRGTSTVVRSDSSHAELEWTISAFSVPGVQLALVSDVTERRRIEGERERLLASERAARAEAERANRLKDDFLATLSHELRTPLNAIVGWTDLLTRGKPDAEDLAEGLESIKRNVTVQSQLIADLLDVSRITTGKLRLDLQLIDPDVLVHAALNSVAAAMTAKNITLRRHLNFGGKIQADPNRLQQIVWNLITNAVKFTPAGGVVEVRIEYDAAGMKLTVRDNGQGISPEFLPHLFDRFSQADASARRVHGGLGIGLAIVKNLTEMHGGTVLAKSEGVGKGAEFMVMLPFMPNQVQHPPSPMPIAPLQKADINPESSGDSLAGARILVVDDDADARKVLRRMLADFDATVMDTGSVAEALKALAAFKPNILISDIGMPGQDGYDLIRQVRHREDDFSKLPAIALTAFSGEGDVSRSRREGFQVHLGKPVNPVALVAEICKLVRCDTSHAE